MKKITLTILVALLFVNSFSQIKIFPVGKAFLGTVPSPNNQDPDNVITFQLFGNGTTGSKSRLAFGDYGRMSTGSMNVFIGENGDYDSDQLRLHGAQGIYLTSTSNSNFIVGYYNPAEGNKFTFTGDVWANGSKLTSDERLKANINKLDNSMVKLRKLNGVSYNLLDKQSLLANKNTVKSTNNTDTIKLTEKEQKNKAFFEAFEANIQNITPKRIGFLAQDLQKVFPELVEKDSSGYYAVDYYSYPKNLDSKLRFI